MAEPTPPPSTTGLIDPVVVPDTTVENQCIDANCTLCAPTPQAAAHLIHESPDRNGVEVRKSKKGRAVRVKIDVEIRLPKKGDRHV